MQRIAVICLLLFAASCNSNEKPATPAENWVLQQDHRYTYTFNEIGLPDTTFVTSLYYKDGALSDTQKTFMISKYNGQILIDMAYFSIGKDKKIEQTSTSHYEYSPTWKIIGTTVHSLGNLTKQETYGYNDSNQLTRNVTVQLLLTGAAPIGSDILPVNSQVILGPNSVKYDTLTGIYRYDNTNKVIGATFTDSRGSLVRTDMNIYSGNDPLYTYSLNAKGDTIQRVKYEPDGKILHSKIENDSLILWQNTMNNIPIAYKSYHKRTKEFWRSAVAFDPQGRKMSEKVYKNM